VKEIIAAIGILFIGGMAVWLLLFKICCQMINDIRSGTRKVPVIRKVVEKYDDCKKLDIAVNNAKAFVEKIMENEKICGLRLKEWERLAGSFKYMIVMLGIWFALVMKDNFEEIYICTGITAMSVVALHLMGMLTDVKGYLSDTVVELVDYLENSGELRSEAGRVKSAKLKGEAASEFMKLNRRYEKICAKSSHT
jgi:hypothetical protein